ncbi:MAG: pilus (MSHA type) biogenesis protein MshL [Magnetococcales bacterium]|nr:pilus (MSHA type) biogenesis protein MshL [Magnetococcales bacterium]
MTRQNHSNIDGLNTKTPQKWAYRPLIGLLMGCLLLTACQPSKIKSSKAHFLRPTDPPAYFNSGVRNPDLNRMPEYNEQNGDSIPDEVYTITVTEMSVRDLLFALARDAGVNIDIYPGIDGKVTLSAIDQTLPQILDRISKQVAIRYEIKSGSIVVSPDLPYLQIYEVDYINIIRNAKSTNSVSTRLSTTTMNTDVDSTQQEESNLSTSGLDTSTTNDFWKSLSRNIQTILNPAEQEESNDTKSQPSIRHEVADDLIGLTPDQPNQETANNTAEEDNSAKKPGIMAINAEAGQISIFASAAQHDRIKEMIDSIMGSVHRQVMIESTVVEVELSDRFQEGVDWDMMFNAATDIGIKGIFSNGEFLTLGRDPNPASTVTSQKAIRAAIKVLETFGNTKVLSSPKITALNNQPAMLKVVKNKVFFTMKSNNSTSSVTGDSNTVTSTPTFDTKIHTVPVGLIMSVTPHISKDGVVTMNVRPTITRITAEVNDPNPALKATTANGLESDITSSIPEIEVKEMETIMRIHSGQVAVMGGLMQDKIVNGSAGVPVLGNMPGIGMLFSHKDRTVTKTELVIFLRPVIVGHHQPKNMQRATYQNSPTNHITRNTRGTPAPQQAIVSRQPQEDTIPSYEEMVKAPSSSNPMQAVAQQGSYLDFTGGSSAPAAQARYVNQTQPANHGIAPPPPAQPTAMPAAFNQPAYPPLPYPGQQSQNIQGGAPTYAQNQQRGFFVDLGSYLEQSHANDVQQKVNAIGLPIQQDSSLVQGQTYQRVRSGPFPSQAAATQAMAKITNYTGIQARVARF